MSTKRPPLRTVRPAVTVTDRGEISAGVTCGSYRQGFAELLDFTFPPTRVTVLPPEASTAIGFTRTGQALCDAMMAFRKSKP